MLLRSQLQQGSLRSTSVKCHVPGSKTQPYSSYSPLAFRATTRFGGSRSVHNLRVVRQGHFSSSGIEERRFDKSCLVPDEGRRRLQYSQSIFHAASESDGRSFLEVARRAGDLPNPKTEHQGLSEHLVVEDEVVRVFQQRKGL